jgi:hypothetical protein
MLPEAVPNARIMRYGYESRWFGDDTVDTVRLKASSIAPQLLQELDIEREVGIAPLFATEHAADMNMFIEMPRSTTNLYCPLFRRSYTAQGLLEARPCPSFSCILTKPGSPGSV